ncbi:MAG: hypothetical protein HWN71_06960 [Desulfobacterales bacterium]|nr:hypothetical protein [Desulfobacterales bacterium]
MDEDAVKHLWTLWRLNKALIGGLKDALIALEKIDKLSPERRQDVIDSLRKLISQNEKLSPNPPTKNRSSASDSSGARR